MKIASTIARYLLGLMFFFFGLNGFLHFIPQPPPTGLAAQFMGALTLSGYLFVIMAVEAIGGLLLLIGRYVPLALLLLAPVIVNVVCFHAFLAPSGLPLAIVVVILWIASAWAVRSAFEPALRSRPAAG